MSPPGRVRFVPYGRHNGEPPEPLHPLELRLIRENKVVSCGDTGPIIDDSLEAEPKEAVFAYPTLGHLWVYEPDDLAEMTLDEVHVIWEHRNRLCGSREVAAEALALVESDTGAVDTYQGWLAYMDRDEIRTFMPQVEPESPLDDQAPCESDDANVSTSRPLTRRALPELNHVELKEAWERRPDSFASLEAACGALARLRAQAGIAADSGWQSLLEHSEILKLEEFLPDHDEGAMARCWRRRLLLTPAFPAQRLYART
ncbi:hypothetical protein R5M92_03805 [Halomonas sp. Bachu 37]|uniref:hypothetical protein n=1 Tax=Halomonas kashgarensis TaxID=3084920 RepID=UPI003217A43B